MVYCQLCRNRNESSTQLYNLQSNAHSPIDLRWVGERVEGGTDGWERVKAIMNE